MKENKPIRNPEDSLHLIIGFSRLIRRNPKAVLTAELAKEIEKHSYGILRLVDNQNMRRLV